MIDEPQLINFSTILNFLPSSSNSTFEYFQLIVLKFYQLFCLIIGNVINAFKLNAYASLV